MSIKEITKILAINAEFECNYKNSIDARRLRFGQLVNLVMESLRF